VRKYGGRKVLAEVAAIKPCLDALIEKRVVLAHFYQSV
jgi:hypothetical protein